jgi:hypothetical protein
VTEEGKLRLCEFVSFVGKPRKISEEKKDELIASNEVLGIFDDKGEQDVSA